MRFASSVLALSMLSLDAGCARGPNISSDLPLRRVVVYRNGVGYFERAGRVDAEQVRFRMRGRMVGDFLATLAIVEQGGGTVRSASFPIDVKDESAEPPPIPAEDRSMLKPWPEPKPDKKDPNKLRDVVLSLDGSEHDLSIGYVAETPVWRPSYRVVVAAGGQADLQTWGIVQNLSGEDWTNVDLVLVAGAPIAFQSTLGTPVIPARPVVNDSGEVIAAVPTGETTLANAPASEPAPPPAVAAPAPEMQAADADEAAPEESRAEGAVARDLKKTASAGSARRASVPMPA